MATSMDVVTLLPTLTDEAFMNLARRRKQIQAQQGFGCYSSHRWADTTHSDSHVIVLLLIVRHTFILAWNCIPDTLACGTAAGPGNCLPPTSEIVS